MARPELVARIEGLMDGLVADLQRLAEISSVSFPNHPREEVLRAHDVLVALLRSAGCRP
ncbi:hypothetical protein [Streptacidiphilus carbonis]|jgi:cysteinylglycine-S-conjugate dipeptidase|uniref:hypothetical protein n=1 Tax=Streptacidiphilus carbonis TaxID=105422 RepID=UPI0013774CCF|nr:hypothetical protein [Streptacidiphilus carbonis]